VLFQSPTPPTDRINGMWQGLETERTDAVHLADRWSGPFRRPLDHLQLS